MHPDDALGARQVGRDLRDRDARRVRGEDRVGANVLLELGEQLLLEVESLGRGLDHELGAREGRREIALVRDAAAVGLHGVETIERALGQRDARPSPARARRR